jgi:hypothetical protein
LSGLSFEFWSMLQLAWRFITWPPNATDLPSAARQSPVNRVRRERRGRSSSGRGQQFAAPRADSAAARFETGLIEAAEKA